MIPVSIKNVTPYDGGDLAASDNFMQIHIGSVRPKNTHDIINISVSEENAVAMLADVLSSGKGTITIIFDDLEITFER